MNMMTTAVSHSGNIRPLRFLLPDAASQHADVNQALGSMQPTNTLHLCGTGKSGAPLPRPPWSSLGSGKALSRGPPRARNSIIYLN